MRIIQVHTITVKKNRTITSTITIKILRKTLKTMKINLMKLKILKLGTNTITRIKTPTTTVKISQ
jgi:hypothetical protein